MKIRTKHILITIPIILLLALVAAVAYPFFVPVTLYRGISLPAKGQPYFTAEEISFRSSPDLIKEGAIGEISAKDVSIAGKFKLKEIRGPVRLRGKGLAVDPITADFMGGRAGGKARVSFDDGIIYEAELDMSGADPEETVKALKMTDRISLTGSVDGRVRLVMSKEGLTVFEGDLAASSAGGILSIKDKGWLERIASYAGEDVDVVVENLTNFRYNEGTLHLTSEGSDIMMDVYLDGDLGRYDLKVVLHDINPRRKK